MLIILQLVQQKLEIKNVCYKNFEQQNRLYYKIRVQLLQKRQKFPFTQLSLKLTNIYKIIKSSMSNINRQHHSNSKSSKPFKEKNEEKTLIKIFKQQRSSTTHLNQQSTIMLFEKSQDFKRLNLLKRQGHSMSSLVASTGVTKRQSQQKNKDFQKVDQLLINLKNQKFKPHSTHKDEIKFTQFSSKQGGTSNIKRIIKTSNSNTRASFHKKSSSSGKLILGKNIFPEKIPTKQERWNPFYQKPHIITQNMINSKGLYNLLSAGILPKQYDFIDILNNKYEVVELISEQKYESKPAVVMKIQENETFMTNPNLLKEYQSHKKATQAQLSDKGNVDEIGIKKQSKIRKNKLKKVKKVKNDPLQKLTELFSQQNQLLSIINGKVQRNQQYKNHLKKCLKQGIQQDLFSFINRVQNFSLKYGIKKFRIKPVISFIKSIKQLEILSLIENYKILGYNRTVKTKQNHVKAVILRAIDRYRFKKIKVNLLKIQKIKKYFRIKKLYHENIDKRYNFFKYRLGSFAEQQRKFIQEFQNQQIEPSQKRQFKPKVEIHILTMDCSLTEQHSYYKLRERLRSHMMRLLNCQTTEVIMLVDPIIVGYVKQEMNGFFKMADKMSKNKVLATNLHILYTSLQDQNISSTGRTYFGISSKIISSIRNICKSQKPVIIPYQSSNYLPFIGESLGARLFGGSFTKESIKMIFQDQIQEQAQQKSDNNGGLLKFHKLNIKHTFQMKTAKLRTFELANKYYEDKTNIYELFHVKNKKTMPFRMGIKNKNINQFHRQLALKIITKKQSTKWVLKLSKGKFSRGIAVLQTNDLKIFQQKRKVSNLTEIDIDQVSKIMSQILKDKIILNHPNLMQKQQYLSQFYKDQNSYIQQFIQNSNKICIFGKILPTGQLIIHGTYRKYYTNGVGFGASYPANIEVQNLQKDLIQLSKDLFEQNVFGYVTFQFLLQQRNQKLYFLDFTPNLQEYSSLFFFYKSLFNLSPTETNLKQVNDLLPCSIFYCPFLDNNGNKYDDNQKFMDECRSRKLVYNTVANEGQKFIFYKNDPSMLSLINFASSQFLAIKMCIQAITFLVQVGGKFNQFDKEYVSVHDSKTDGLYMMDILWRLREIKKHFQNNQY